MRQAEAACLNEEMANLMKSLEKGADPSAVSAEINSRVADRDRLKAMADAPLPQKISAPQLWTFAAEVR
jgi:hypothetical protein